MVQVIQLMNLKENIRWNNSERGNKNIAKGIS
jgi:hypothetical protein